MVELAVMSGDDLPGAARLLGLTGIKEDLNVVNDVCLVALELLGDDPESVHALDERGRTWLHAYYVTALITYARCFTGGVRTRLDVKHVRAAAGEQADEAVAVHQMLLLTRDKHLAHAVSPYESGVLGVIIRPDSSVWGVDARVYKQNVAPETFGQLRLLVGQLLGIVNNLILKQHSYVLEQARERGAKAWAEAPLAEWFPPGTEDLTRRSSDDRPLPDGAWGYILRVELPEERLESGQVVGAGQDGPMRRRQIWTVRGLDQGAVVQDVGLRADGSGTESSGTSRDIPEVIE